MPPVCSSTGQSPAPQFSRTAREEEGGRSLDALGRRYGVHPKQIIEDIRTLTTLCDHADTERLLSVRAWQQEGHVSVSSQGPFRRPVKLLPDEALALQVALAMDPQGKALAAKFASVREPSATEPSARTSARPRIDLEDLFATAAAEHRRVRIRYAGEGDTGGWQDVIES